MGETQMASCLPAQRKIWGNRLQSISAFPWRGRLGWPPSPCRALSYSQSEAPERDGGLMRTMLSTERERERLSQRAPKICSVLLERSGRLLSPFSSGANHGASPPGEMARFGHYPVPGGVERVERSLSRNCPPMRKMLWIEPLAPSQQTSQAVDRSMVR